MRPQEESQEESGRLASWRLRTNWTDKLYLVLGIEPDEGIYIYTSPTQMKIYFIWRKI